MLDDENGGCCAKLSGNNTWNLSSTCTPRPCRGASERGRGVAVASPVGLRPHRDRPPTGGQEYLEYLYYSLESLVQLEVGPL
jgi:hypothetical protein